MVYTPEINQSTTTENGGAPTFADIENNRLENHPLKPDSQEAFKLSFAPRLRLDPGSRWTTRSGICCHKGTEKLYVTTCPGLISCAK
jgi:hypothetical protein